MLADHPHQRSAIGLGHRIIGLNFFLGVNPLLKRIEKLLRLLSLRIGSNQTL